MVQELETLVLKLHDIGAIRFGDFILHSGRKSPIYIDLRLLASFPEALRMVAKVYRPLLEGLSYDLIAATPLAGLPIGTAISLEMDIPLVYPRGSSKSYGTGKLIEGKWSAGQKAILVDDLITSGDSLLKAIRTLEGAGLRVVDTIVLIDRQQGGREMLAELGYNFHCAIAMNQLLDILQRKDRITQQTKQKVYQSLR